MSLGLRPLENRDVEPGTFFADESGDGLYVVIERRDRREVPLHARGGPPELWKKSDYYRYFDLELRRTGVYYLPIDALVEGKFRFMGRPRTERAVELCLALFGRKSSKE